MLAYPMRLLARLTGRLVGWLVVRVQLTSGNKSGKKIMEEEKGCEMFPSYLDPPSAPNQITLINGEKFLLCDDQEATAPTGYSEPSFETLVSFTTCKEMLNIQASLQSSASDMPQPILMNSTLLKTALTHTVNETNNNAVEDKKIKSKHLHFCQICKKGFKDRYSVNVHVRTHTGEKPFCCTRCGKAFRQKAHLAKHSHTHVIK